MNIYDEIEYEDLTPDLKLIADSCGIVTVRQLLKNLGGLTFYIPKITKLKNFVRRKWDEGKTKNFKEFARVLMVSETYLRKQVK